jgi:hypothetical protein
MFWGIVAVPEGETVTTIFASMRSRLASPRGRIAVLALIVLEIAGLSTWVYVEHGEHLMEFADIGLARLKGQDVIYANMCGKGGQTRIRLVFDHGTAPST